MSTSTSLTRIGLLGWALAGVALPSCGGDDDPDGSSGHGGTSASAGKGGSAGKGASGGTSGSAGKGGAAGSGSGGKGGGASGRGSGGTESGTGGTGGTGAGDGGTGGSSAGTGGTDAGSGGSDAGMGGTDAGMGGTDPGTGGSQAGSGQSGEGGEGGEGTPGSLVVTPEGGGTISFGGTTVVVPPGAVSVPTTITIQSVEPSSIAAIAPGFERVGPTVALLPHGQTFLVPVTVTLSHTEGSVLAHPAVLRLDDEADTTWEGILPSNADASSVTFTTTSFSDLAPVDSPCGPTLVISALYSQGGRYVDQLDNDYVELHNRSSVAIRLNGLGLQTNDGSNPTTWSVTALGGSLAAGGYYLVRLGRDSLQTGTPLPTPDATGTYNLSPSGGRLAITIDTTPLTGGSPWSFYTAVGYSSTNHKLEGEAVPAAAATAASAIARHDSGCKWTRVNQDDLALTTTHSPLSSASTPVVCSCD